VTMLSEGRCSMYGRSRYRDPGDLLDHLSGNENSTSRAHGGNALTNQLQLAILWRDDGREYLANK